MACCHQHNHQPSPSSCSHHSHPPAPPPLDPLLLQSIVSILLHHYPTPSAAAFHGSARSPLDHQSCCSDQSEHHNRKDSPPPHHASVHVSEPNCSAHSSLLQRMDSLESSFQRFSSAPSPDSTLSLRELAARRIQVRFRAFLVHRSRAFRRLKELTAVNSTVDKIKSVESSSVSPPEIIEDGDEMAVDSKRLIVRAFAEFLEQVEGVFLRGNGVSSKAIKDILAARNDEKSKVSKESEVVGHAEKGSEYCNLDKNGKPLTNNLRESVRRRFHEIFEEVRDEDEGRHCKGAEDHNRLQSKAEKHVRFIEEENATKVHITDGSLIDSTSTVSGNVKKIEDAVEKQQDDVEMNSNGKKNPAESVEGSEDDEETENENDDCEDDETENEGSGEEYESEEDEDEAENEVCECGGAENATGNLTQPTSRDSENEDEVETENESGDCEDEDETENEGSEEEYETENEVCEEEGEEEDDDDEDETEYEGSEYEEDEEEEGSEIEDEVEKGGNSNIEQDNNSNSNAQVQVQVVDLPRWGEHNLVKNKKRDMRNVICHICLKRGHMKVRCWYNPTRLCNKCRMIGHAEQVCGIVSKQLSQTSDS